MTCMIPANLLNTLGKTLKVFLSGFYTISMTGSSGTLNITVQLGGLNVCSRTTLATYSATTPNDPWEMTCYITTQTAGSSAYFEAQGLLLVNLSTPNTSTANAYPILNTTTVGTVDTTMLETLQVTITFSTNQATPHANSAIERQLIVEVMN
jgi:hypothetical protein